MSIRKLISLIRRFSTHELISGAGVIFVSSLLGSFLNFLYNLFMSRNLSVSDYGVLASLISLMTLFALPAGAVIPSIIRFAGSYFAKGNLNMVRGLYFKVIKPLFILGIFVFMIFLVFTREIGQFFNINNKSLIIIAGLNVLLGFVSVVNSPLLQAKLVFTFIALTNFVGSVLKLLLGAVVVLLGFSIGGVMWALFFSSLIQYFLSFLKLKFLFKKGVSAPKVDTGELFIYGAPAALALFGLASFITTDIILIKHFFNPSDAGIYAGMSLIGKVIFFFSAPIGTVMFPLIVQKHTRSENYHNIFKLSLLIVLIPSIAITTFYFIFPEFTIRFFTKREEYVAASSYLGIFGIFITMYSLLSIVTNFYLSIKKTKVFIPIIIGALSQIILIWIFHQSFLQIIIISLITVSLLLFLLLLYYGKLYGKKTN